MSTFSSRATAGAGPSAAITLEPICHEARRPDVESVVVARATWVGSGPNSAAYSAGDTERPDAINDVNRPGLRGCNPKLRSTVTVASAGPSLTALRMALASV